MPSTKPSTEAPPQQFALQPAAATPTARLMRLFESAQYHSRYDPATARPDPANPRRVLVGPRKRLHMDLPEWQRHVSGEWGLSVAPNLLDGTASWGAIDIDDYDIDLGALAARIRHLRISALVVRTKSGGGRVLVFFDRRLPTHEVNALLRALCSRLGLSDREIFPREQSPGSRPFTINTPYCGYESSILHLQVAIRPNGGEIGLSEFVRMAEATRMGADERARLMADAPPPAPIRRKTAAPVQAPVVEDEITAMWRGDAGKGLEVEDTELKIQFALRAIPDRGYHEWMRIGGMIACALRGLVDDDGRGLWEDWSGPRDNKTNKCCAERWRECMKFTAFSRDGSSIFYLADNHDADRLWRRAYEIALTRIHREGTL